MVEKSTKFLILYIILSLVIIITLGISLFSKNTIRDGTVITSYILSIIAIIASYVCLFNIDKSNNLINAGAYISFIISIVLLFFAVGYSDKKNGYSNHKIWKIMTFLLLSVSSIGMIALSYKVINSHSDLLKDHEEYEEYEEYDEQNNYQYEIRKN